MWLLVGCKSEGEREGDQKYNRDEARCYAFQKVIDFHYFEIVIYAASGGRAAATARELRVANERLMKNYGLE
ncbi:hypothetical protein TSAR_010716 [Trichomalopsis sarcophagae]|uniref:Uncharacterized protein n=1 Tax=Trichomalopsis sarcophagae TaxID=543379 RepID=A0A232F3W9_9HYME|nr:hypothetical protein TSAR_010716 [Trichomalopsis sarcophagae]